MTIKVPAVGEVLVLKNFLNNTAPQNQILHLYQNNITPSNTDVAGTYTESTWGGYATNSLTGGNWGVSSGNPSSALYNTQMNFTYNGGAGAGQTVFGYYVTQAVSGILMWAERDSNPFVINNNGDQYQVTPAINCDST